MQEKLKKLMKHEGINSTRLAEILGIQPSGISHIMSGRNNPSYDFLVKLLQRFPQISPDWLMMDKGPMYRDEVKKKNTSDVSVAAPSSPDAFRSGERNIFTASNYDADLQQDIPQTDTIGGKALGISGRIDTGGRETAPGTMVLGSSASSSSSAVPVSGQSLIERIVVFYKDKTFSEYIPE